MLKTVELRWGLPALTARDAAAPDIGAVLTLASPRTDDPLAGVVVPVASQPNPSADLPSHLLQVHAQLVSRLPVPGHRTCTTTVADERRLHVVHQGRGRRRGGKPGPRTPGPQSASDRAGLQFVLPPWARSLQSSAETSTSYLRAADLIRRQASSRRRR